MLLSYNDIVHFPPPPPPHTHTHTTGKTLHHEVQSSVRCILESIIKLTTAIIERGIST